jgi:hypothetical protein
MLSFEHSILVNDPERADRSLLTRDELWAGLVYRARRPDHFNPALRCHIEEIDETRFIRVIKAGDLELRDEVRLVLLSEVRTLIDGRHQPIHAESCTRIEETAAGLLSVRFSYRRDSLNAASGLDADEYLKSAYRQLDKEAVELIRQMAAEGWSRAIN